MTVHSGQARDYRGTVTGALWYRGGCAGCSWLGPFRERKLDAVRDARQHLVDVNAYPDPTPHG